MVVNDLHGVSVTVAPTEADALLFIDSNALLAGPVPGQGLQSVTGQCGQVAQRGGAVGLIELPFGGTGERL